VVLENQDTHHPAGKLGGLLTCHHARAVHWSTTVLPKAERLDEVTSAWAQGVFFFRLLLKKTVNPCHKEVYTIFLDRLAVTY